MIPASKQAIDESEGLASYWHVLVRRRWTVLTVALALTLIVAVVSLCMKPAYVATARLEVEPETPLLESISDIYQRVDADDPFIQTQIQVLKGPTLAWQTIEQLNLAGRLDVLSPEQLRRQEIEGHKVELIGAFQNRLKVELLPKTRMLSVGFESADPELSAQVATGLANAYLDYNFRQKYEAIRRSGWMEQQVEDLRKNVEASQQALVNYEQQNHIVDTGDKENILTQTLSDLSHDLTAAKSQRIQQEALYVQVLRNRSEMASLVHDDLLQKLEGGLADLKGQYATALAQYGPNFPKATRLQLQINDQEAQIKQEQDRVLDRMRHDYNAARDRERLASAAVANQKEQVGNLNQLMVQDNILRHEFETNQQLYQSLLGRLKDATVSAGLRSTGIRLVDSALPPSLPVRPRKALYTLVALWAGLILGVMCAFAQDMMDSSVKSAEEAESLILAPALGVLPFDRSSTLQTCAFLRKKAVRALPLTLSNSPNSSLSEAFRALGTAVSLSPNLPRTVLITSAENAEGKTVTTVNLGQVMAQRKGPVLIIDCDLRRNGIALALGLKNDKGMSTVLSGNHDVSEALQQCADQPNLWALTSGPMPRHPAELLASDKMTDLLQQMTKRFACVIIDSPPVLAVTDATILSTLVDGVLLVVASGSTPRGGLIRARRILANAGANVLGVAVNKLDPRFQSYRNYGYSYIDADWRNASAKVS
jgi:capsular exopolysaccharide synthesis family protein